MSFKPFFIHFNRPVTKHDSSTRRSRPRGFTAYVSPSDKPRTIVVQGAFCASQDEFVRAAGRSYAIKAETLELNPRMLPDVLAEMANACGLYREERLTPADYCYVLKYVV